MDGRDDMTRTVLVLTNVFPPDVNGRATRLRARIKYLVRNHDWDPVILVWDEGRSRDHLEIDGEAVPVYRAAAERSTGEAADDSGADAGASPLDDLVDDVKERVGDWLVPDLYVTSLPGMLRNAHRVLSVEDVDAIYTMCYPFSFHLGGWVLSKRYDLAWLAEFRDPWVTNPNHFDGRAGWPHTAMEERVVRECDRVVYNYGIQIPEGYFAETYGVGEKVTRLTCPGSCGFDFERLDDAPAKHEAFTITYGGTFYGDGHSPERFLRGLARFLEASDRSAAAVNAEFYGDWDDEYDRLVADLGLSDAVTPHGWADFETFITALRRSHVALFVVRPFPGDRMNVPQKVIDYVAADVPMLVLANADWEIADYTTRHGVGQVVNPDDPAAVKAGLADLYERYEAGTLDELTADEDLRREIDAETQTRAFAAALDSAVARREGGRPESD